MYSICVHAKNIPSTIRFDRFVSKIHKFGFACTQKCVNGAIQELICTVANAQVVHLLPNLAESSVCVDRTQIGFDQRKRTKYKLRWYIWRARGGLHKLLHSNSWNDDDTTTYKAVHLLRVIAWLCSCNKSILGSLQ